MTTTRGLDQKEYNGIKVGEMMRNIEFGWIGKVVCFDFERGDVFCVIVDADGVEHGALLETYEFYTPQNPQ